MRVFFRAIDDFLRGRGVFAVDAPLSRRLRWLFILLVVCGLFYGAVMGTYSGLAPGRFHQLLYSGLKVPLLLLVTFGLCLPSFFVVNTIAGLRDDFGQALRALVATQSCVTVVLAGLAPVTAFWYLSCADYRLAVLFNGAMFAVASVAAQIVVRRYYGPLIGRSARHRQLLWAWFFLYAFVGIQMGWVLRPFIGDPDLPVAFFRSGAWGNAYVVVSRMVVESARRLAPDPLLWVLWIWAIALLVGLIVVFLRFFSPRGRE
jgi:hypothetical protein